MIHLEGTLIFKVWIASMIEASRTSKKGIF